MQENIGNRVTLDLATDKIVLNKEENVGNQVNVSTRLL